MATIHWLEQWILPNMFHSSRHLFPTSLHQVSSAGSGHYGEETNCRLWIAILFSSPPGPRWNKAMKGATISPVKCCWWYGLEWIVQIPVVGLKKWTVTFFEYSGYPILIRHRDYNYKLKISFVLINSSFDKHACVINWNDQIFGM